MSDSNTTLKEAITKAADEQGMDKDKDVDAEDTKAQRDTKNEKSSKENEEDESEDNSDDKEENNGGIDSDNTSTGSDTGDDKEDDEEIETALALLRGLRDPKQSASIIQDLALRIGLIQSPKEELTKKEAKDVKTLLKETLAEDYPDLRDKLEVVFGKILEDSDAKINALKQEIAQRDRSAAEREFTSELNVFLKENKIDDKMADMMIKEMQLIPPGPKISLKSYLTKIHNLVTHASTKQQLDAKRIEKINNNRKESSVRNLSSDVSDGRIKKGSQLPSLKEAIALAMEESMNK